MTKADKKDEVMKEQLETEALMDAEVEAATDCGPVSHKVEKKEKEKALSAEEKIASGKKAIAALDAFRQAKKEGNEQAETEALMDAEVEAATDCGCGCGCSKK